MAWLQQILAALLILTFALSAVWLSNHTLANEETTYLSETASRVAAGLDREWRENGDLTRGAKEELEEYQPPGVRVEIRDEAQHVVAVNTTGSPPDPADIRETRVHLPRGAWVVASMSLRHRRVAIEALVSALALAGIPLFLIIVFASRGFARRALRPLSRMAQAAEGAAQHGVIQPLGERDDPAEVAQLSAAFNRLLARLDHMLQVERHFTQDAAHELRTPLGVVSGEIEYARSHRETGEALQPGLANAASQVRAMNDLVEALLFLRRSDSLGTTAGDDFAPVSLSELVRETTNELLSRFPERSNDVHVRTNGEALVNGHAVLLAAGYRNLLANALQATSPGQPIEIGVQHDADRWTVVVEDSGSGIDPAERERVFDPFFRGAEARSDRNGSGLGLHILRRVARAHRGEVAVMESRLGGARFELRLPMWSPRAAKTEESG
jgi:signal transduction histidine kinase